MTMTKTAIVLLAATLLTLGCDNSPKKTEGAANQKPAIDTVTGRFALQKMLPPARIWAADAKPVRLQSSLLGGTDGHEGKASFWRCMFGSAARQKAETFTWSGMDTPDIPQGINHGAEDSYNPANRSTQGFALPFLKVDSDQAFDMAQQHGGKQLLAKNSKQEVIYMLDWDPSVNELNWHVIYGNSESNAKLTIIVNASEGKFVRKE